MFDVRKQAETVATLVQLYDGMSSIDKDRRIVGFLMRAYLREIEASLPVTRFNEVQV
jgi:hypothetical protein